MSTPESAGETPDEACCSGTDHGIDPAALDCDVRLLSAMANDTRYELLRLIGADDEDGVCVCELVPNVEASQSTVSHALSSLRSAGLVDRRKEGRWRYYRTTDRADALLDALDDTREGSR